MGVELIDQDDVIYARERAGIYPPMMRLPDTNRCAYCGDPAGGIDKQLRRYLARTLDQPIKSIVKIWICYTCAEDLKTDRRRHTIEQGREFLIRKYEHQKRQSLRKHGLVKGYKKRGELYRGDERERVD